MQSSCAVIIKLTEFKTQAGHIANCYHYNAMINLCC